MRSIFPFSKSASGALVTLILCTGLVPRASAAAAPEQSNPAYERLAGTSLALNIALATGLTTAEGPLRDATREELGPDLKDIPTRDLSLFSVRDQQVIDGLRGLAGNAIPKLAAKLSPGLAGHLGPNLSPAMGGLSLFVGLFGPTKQPHPVTKQQVIAWMPAELAEDPKAAKVVMEKMLRDALVRVYVEDLRWEFGEEAHEMNPRMAPKRTYVLPVVRGGSVCGKDGIICQVKSHASKPIEVAAAPSYLGGKPAYLWRNYLPGQTDFDMLRCGSFIDPQTTDRFLSTYKQPIPELIVGPRAYWTAMSSKLPDWFFMYLPPDQVREYPTLLRQGKELVFVAPAEGEEL